MVSIVHAQMELQDSIDQALVEAVMPEIQQPQQPSIEPSRSNFFAKQQSKQSKRKKQAPSKTISLEKPALTPAKKHTQVGKELSILETALPDTAQLRIPKKKKSDSSQVPG